MTNQTDGNYDTRLLATISASLTTLAALAAAVTDDLQTASDTSFVTGDSPATIDMNDALSRNATSFTVFNDGPGDFTIATSNNGAAFGGEHTMKSSEVFSTDDLSVDTLRITWVADSAYRVVFV